MTLYTFLHNLLNVLIEIGNKTGLQQKLITLRACRFYCRRPTLMKMKFLSHFRSTDMKKHKSREDDSDDNITDDENSSLFSNGYASQLRSLIPCISSFLLNLKSAGPSWDADNCSTDQDTRDLFLKISTFNTQCLLGIFSSHLFHNSFNIILSTGLRYCNKSATRLDVENYMHFSTWS
jgi:hypothetical protein